ncbi:MAG TPA: sensor histidine kinase [Candidatus Dormibacteraeota bacterium]|nr:sensor histidine kinase [Candidatus Dormibacteraeota bacterium]
MSRNLHRTSKRVSNLFVLQTKVTPQDRNSGGLDQRRYAVYPPNVQRSSVLSPTLGLILGLAITVAAVVAYAWYTTAQISGLRKLQNEFADRNRKDSLQLLRIQNDLNSLGLAMRDMLDADEQHPLAAWSAEFERIHADLDDALRLEAQLAVAARTPDQRQYLENSFAQFWDAANGAFSLARGGDVNAARNQVRLALQPRQASLTNAVARLLVENYESEGKASAQVLQIYDRVQRQVYFFLAATLAAILATGLYLIHSNRSLFERLASLSRQRSELARQLIATQESTLRHISRELHDEFGQTLTAVGALLSRAEKQMPDGSAVREELHEVRDIAQQTLENVRSLSQSLHPVMLDETGLESTVDWYLPMMERQTGITVHYEKSGASFPIDGGAGIHVYRILQEALNNIVRHSGSREAWVRLRFLANQLELDVEDHGTGFESQKSKPGIGLVAMRERAQLLEAAIEISQLQQRGTLVRLSVPRRKLDPNGN